MTPTPQLDERVVEAAVALELQMAAKDDSSRPVGPRRLLLVHGRYAPESPDELTVDGRKVYVRRGESVLGMYELWQEHLNREDRDSLLVLATALDAEEISADLRAQAMHRGVQHIERWQLVRQRFGARGLDPRLRGGDRRWLAEALLSAEPDGGWPRISAAALDYDTALRNLVCARFGLPSGTVDAEALLTWSLIDAMGSSYTRLSDEERAGIRRWLIDTVGAPARVLLALADAERSGDAMAVGILGTVLWDPRSAQEADLARVAGRVETVFRGAVPEQAELHAFAEAVAGVLLRWFGEAAGNGPRSRWAREHAERALDRAEALAAEYGAGQSAERNRLLRSGLHARLLTLAGSLAAGDSAAAARALDRVLDHEYAALEPLRVAPARMAVRLLHWFDSAQPDQPGGAAPETVAEGIAHHLREWGWVDRALTTLRAGDPVSGSTVANAYREVIARVQTRRDEFDLAFARRLAAWCPHGTTGSGLLGVEDVLRSVCEPLVSADGGQDRSIAPLLLVLDGMSSAVAVELAEQIRDASWTEITPGEHRTAALAMIPSITRISRASLLTGRPNAGGQQSERDGFTSFWNRRHRTAALFHKADLTGFDGSRLATPVVQALSEPGTVVAIVLNTIDDALDKNRMGDRTGWSLADITHLDVLLDAARGYNRPIVLVSDHGHVLDRGGSDRAIAHQAPSVRWRAGEPGEGEIALTGPRVLENDGSVVVPWRGDLRYAQRRAGYHGGASLAEMTVPVLVFLPGHGDAPRGWRTLAKEDTTPPWWRETLPASAAVSAPSEQRAPSRSKSRRATAGPQEEALFTLMTAPTAPERPQPAASLGAQVIASDVYRRQLAMLRRKPQADRVAAVIDALDAAGGSLSATKAIEVMGSSAARLSGTFAALQRLLNVETYPVLTLLDGGRTARLDVRLLREQFGV